MRITDEGRNKKMKKNKKIICPYCGARAILRDGTYVYGERSKGEKLYVCSNYPKCDSYVGVHRGTTNPMGTLADASLRNKRIKTHKIFDLIWKNNLMTRKEAYRWMEYFMGIPKNSGHIANFSDYRCELLMDKCRETLANNHIELPLGA